MSRQHDRDVEQAWITLVFVVTAVVVAILLGAWLWATPA